MLAAHLLGERPVHPWAGAHARRREEHGVLNQVRIEPIEEPHGPVQVLRPVYGDYGEICQLW